MPCAAVPTLWPLIMAPTRFSLWVMLDIFIRDPCRLTYIISVHII